MPIIHSSTPEWSAEMENRLTLECVLLVWVFVEGGGASGKLNSFHLIDEL